ncbi:(deoxy)nucleoside triphosphate pyrophosphohydrolase [Ferrimonas sediminicola]|uniref:8-oxo-dGTP diphosphatase n=1 Tax=Ferrimonas sediminicola TaxID=2569538 RepID=A0A4U1BCS2_9GAMM|nr:(deoxy)nucleoside triphosphate pyrophosphohydrolase [Ferrimonas sediminicola]TKB48710.1 (deoxy)nucleoside triphosphate pyrophosphohydrolase [Ferrimonas sediminicola]
MLEVACALIVDGDKLLLCRRHPNGSQGGLWEFPGGKCEPGETLPQALARELKEELCLDLEIGHHLGTSEHHYGNKGVRLHGYHCRWHPQAITLTGSHDRYLWVEPGDIELQTLAPADLPLLRALIRQQGSLPNNGAIDRAGHST